MLLTLSTGQFLMTLDSAVMNVSIAQVAEDVGTTVTGVQTAITLYTLVMATMMITGGKIGSMIGRRKAFCHRLRHLRGGVIDDRLVPKPDSADHRMVDTGGVGRGADHAGDRGSGGLQLPAFGAGPGLWVGGLGRRHSRRGRPFDRGRGDHLLDVALCVRRRGGPRHRHPGPESENEGRTAGATAPTGPRGCGIVRDWTGIGRFRSPPFGRVGLGEAKARRAPVVGAVDDALADSRRNADRLAVLRMGRTPHNQRAENRWSAPKCSRISSWQGGSPCSSSNS